jgi:hypothetical protein
VTQLLKRKGKKFKGEDNDKTGIRTLVVCTRAKLSHLQDGQDKLDYQLLVSLPD